MKNNVSIPTEELVEVELDLHPRWTEIKNSKVKLGIKSLFRNVCCLSLEKLQNTVIIGDSNTDQEYDIFFQIQGFKGRVSIKDVNNIINDASKLNAVWFSPSKKSLLFCYYSRPLKLLKNRMITLSSVSNSSSSNNSNNTNNISNEDGNSLNNNGEEEKNNIAISKLKAQYLKKAENLVVENRDSLSRELLSHFRAAIDGISEKFMNYFCQDLTQAKIHIDNIGDNEFSLHYDNLIENMHCTALWSIFGSNGMKEILSMSFDFENGGISFVVQPVCTNNRESTKKRQRIMELLLDGIEDNNDAFFSDDAHQHHQENGRAKRIKR